MAAPLRGLTTQNLVEVWMAVASPPDDQPLL